MKRQEVRAALAACALAFVVALSVRAADEPKAGDADDPPKAKPAQDAPKDEAPKQDAPKQDAPKQDAPAAPAAPVVAAPAADCCAPASSAPAYRTVCVTAYRCEPYTCTRTAYRTECVPETYTAYRTECTSETRTRTYTVCRRVPECVTQTRTVCVSVPCVEQRTIMKQHVSYRPVTCYVSKWEDHGHYECREVACGPSFHDRMKKCFHHKSDCCEECEQVHTKTVKEWVPCKVCVQVPVTRCEKVVECVPCTINVTVCKKELRQETYQCTVWKSVPEVKTETYCVQVPHCVPYQATRMVSRCVPYQETVTLNRMVPYTVEKQVPVESCCENLCSSSKKHHLFGH
jgi:hypothetical protein